MLPRYVLLLCYPSLAHFRISKTKTLISHHVFEGMPPKDEIATQFVRMEKTIGKKLHELRKQSGFTQDYVAEKLGVSAQAVSKWENDIACPDIMTLPNIASLYGITIDELFKNEEVQSNVKYEVPEQINEDDLMLRVYVDTFSGDKVKVSLPYPIVKEFVKAGKNISAVVGGTVVSGVDLTGVDFDAILKMVSNGILGEIVNVQTQNNDVVRVVVEK